MKLARERSIPALQKLTSIMLNGTGAASVRAAEIIIERAWGRAPQKTELTGADGEPLNMGVQVADVVMALKKMTGEVEGK